jgi:hypothetical protein
MKGVLMAFFLLYTLFVSAQVQRIMQFENCYEELVEVKDRAVLIVVKDLYCSICFEDLKKTLKAIPRGARVYLLLDGIFLNAQRVISARQVAEKSGLKIDFKDVLFASDKTFVLSEKVKNYEEENKSPFLVLSRGDKFELVTYDQLYSLPGSLNTVKKEIRSFLKS